MRNYTKSNNFNRFRKPSGGSEQASAAPARSRGGYSRDSQGGSSRREVAGRQPEGKKEFPFARVGSITVPKSLLNKEGHDIINHIKDSLKGVTLWADFYIDGGQGSLEVKSGDKVMLTFNPTDKAPDFVVGTLFISNE